MAKKLPFWNIHKILTYQAQYYIAVGERSNGKTYGTLEYCLEEYFNHGSEFAYVRRWDDDIKGDRGADIFNALINNRVIKKLSRNRYDSVKYRGRNYYLCGHDDKGNEIVADRPFAYAFAISMQEHYKGLSYPRIDNIIFDEFLTRGAYLPNEFILFQNLLSTIIRLRDNVKIFMLGNTVNKFSPYTREMGLYRLDKQEQGTIDIYEYGESGLRVALEYCGEFDTKAKKSNKYFAFNNPRLNMVKHGSWEIDIYPHYPKEYKAPIPNDVLYTFYIIFEGNTLSCKVIDKPEETITDIITNKKRILPAIRFLFIHPKTKPINDDDTGLIYCQEANAKPNYRMKITKPTTRLEKRLVSFFARDKVFYSDNETGEIVRNYIAWCKN